MDVQVGPRTEMTEDRSDQGPKWMHTAEVSNLTVFRNVLAQRVLVIVSYTSVSMNGRFCDLLTTENDVISEKRT